MNPDLPPELERFIEQQVASGRYSSREQLLADAVRLLRERQPRLDELRLEIQQGYDEIRRGEGIALRNDAELREFFADIKRRGRERYDASPRQ